MLPVRAPELYDAARQLSQLATRQSQALHANDQRWETLFAAGSDADFLQAARRSDSATAKQQAQVISQMSAVAGVLSRAAEVAAALEIDVDKLTASLDRIGQRSRSVDLLLAEIAELGKAVDRACAQEITAICTEQQPTNTTLSDFSDASQQEIHEFVVSTAGPEIRALAERFPTARFMPASDGVILAFGEIDTAPAVTTLVPGVGSADPADWAGYATRAQGISRTTGGAAVLWIDYRAPNNLLAATATGPASIGATRLRDFQAELKRRAARVGNEPHLTVVGHSYGSVVTGHAAQGRGLTADAVVFAGSPGVGVHRADQLNLKSERPRVIATTSTADPIGLSVTARSGVHGPDPADPEFGAEVWPAAGGHSAYWTDPEFHRRLRTLQDRNP
ncbi:alpha/beta hydrolase [Corynebacterium sp. H128]|uniref:alpha/beta hydrolase n=1 Tax=Corynebacterium sp. H128 TaxID=3133427 RepID=UPI0030A44F8C